MKPLLLELGGDKMRLAEGRKYKGWIIPKGFETDGASLPWFLWSMMGGRFRPRTLRGAVVHDYLYVKQVGRATADREFYEILRGDGVRFAWVYYYGVRAFGWWAYKKLTR